MRRTITISIVVILLITLAVILIVNPELIKNIWLWLVGFAGFIYAGIRRLGEMFSGNDRLKELEESNKQIKENHSRITREMEAANKKLAEERAAHAAEIARLNVKINELQEKYEKNEEELLRVSRMNYQEYIDNLPAGEKDKIIDQAWKDVDFGL
ncbi:MAG: hypothetical protein WD077_13855 [Bacteroidia bacterium]